MACSDKAASAFVPFPEATKVEKLGSHTYRVNLVDAYCIGAVPNGGYAGSCMLAAASAHLSSRGQPDMVTAHFEYPSQAATGPAIVVVEDVKLARRLSIVHLTLWQGGLTEQAPLITPSVSRRAVLAYATYTNLRTFTGMSVQTGHEAAAAAALPAPPRFDELRQKGADEHWKHAKLPPALTTWRSLRNWCFYIPRGGQLAPGTLDMWIRLASGERITQAALPYVADSFPWNLHTFLLAPGDGGAEAARRNDQRTEMWFPTVTLNLEVKTALPEEGVEWLAVRVTSKQIKDGRFDLDITIRDAEGQLVALSHHVAMIVDIAKNRGNGGKSTL
ncbi:thioesterase family protein [Biscogniauxia sp. FL1348]|nr:thioesterase family protein [Biscogniauxia sp. FL1348]